MKIGLTGGIAAGKSAVANLLAELGAVLVDADVLAREVVAPGSDGLAGLQEMFGDAILTEAGELNRGKLGEIIFSDDQQRKAVEQLLHPMIRARGKELAAANEDAPAVVHVIPLLVETGQQNDFDEVVVVDVPESLQVERMMTRDGLSETEAQARIDAQASRTERLAAATWVIDNSGSLADTADQVQDFWQARVLDQ